MAVGVPSRSRNVSDTEKPLPAFGEEVLVKRRKWRTMDMESKREKVFYVAPPPDERGHTVLRPHGTMVVAPYLLAHT